MGCVLPMLFLLGFTLVTLPGLYLYIGLVVIIVMVVQKLREGWHARRSMGGQRHSP